MELKDAEACDPIRFRFQASRRVTRGMHAHVGSETWGVHGGTWGVSNKGYLDTSCMAYPRLTGDLIFSMILPRCGGKTQ